MTYRGRREADGHPVILKVLRLDRIKDWKAAQLFQREAAVLRELAHPSIPAHIDDFALGTEDAPEGFVLVQEFIPGVSLAGLMKEGQRLDEPQMLGWFLEVLRVLDYLHRLSPPVIHRDVTPKNIVRKPDGRAVLVDFGSVQAAIRSENSVSSTAAGTFGYAPPEQFIGRATPSSDLYGAAMTFLAVSSGRQPDEMPLDGARVDVPAFFKGDRRLVNLLHLMTEPDPRKRLGDAATALQRLAGILGQAPESEEPLTPSGRPAAPTRSEAESRVGDVDAYVALLKSRLREEGFVVLAGGTLGDLRVKLVAHRKGASRKSATSTYVYVARDHDLRAAAQTRVSPFFLDFERAEDQKRQRESEVRAM